MATEKQGRIGYFGGSITEGAGASDAAQTSWRALTTAWFQSEFPDAQIHEISAALGGTGSMLGAFRLGSDLLRYKPDLVFVEFAVNDDLRADDAEGARQKSRAIEGIVRHIKRELPDCEIVFVYTLTQSMARELGDDGLPASTRLHETIARHYAIPAVNVGQALLENIEVGANNWASATIDGVHPSDAGYRIYAETLSRALRNLRDNAHESSPIFPVALDVAAWQNVELIGAADLSRFRFAETPTAGLAPPSHPGAKENLRLEGGASPAARPVCVGTTPFGRALNATGWQVAATPPATMTAEWHPERYATRFLVANQPQTTLKFDFSGAICGLFYLIAPDSGDIEFSIDDGAFVRLSMWDSFARQFTRPSYRILADELAPGPHQLTLRIVATNHENSTGNWVRLLGLLVEQARET